jgi:hypothetical protein
MLTRDIHDFTLPFLFYYFGYATVLSQSCITGLYASRNTYIRVGVAEWKVTNPVHVVCIHIYMYYHTMKQTSFLKFCWSSFIVRSALGIQVACD